VSSTSLSSGITRPGRYERRHRPIDSLLPRPRTHPDEVNAGRAASASVAQVSEPEGVRMAHRAAGTGAAVTGLLLPVRRRLRRGARLLGVALLLAFAVSAVGCDDASDDQEPQPSAAEAWADQLCSTAGDWRTAIEDAQVTLTDTSNLSANAVRGAVDDVATATTTLVTELGQIGPPDTEAGDAAAAQLSALSDALGEQQAVISDTRDQPADSAQALLAQVSTVTGAIASMLSAISVSVDNISQLDGAQELRSAFQASSACQELRASASPSP
jgi:hypothetical protein